MNVSLVVVVAIFTLWVVVAVEEAVGRFVVVVATVLTAKIAAPGTTGPWLIFTRRAVTASDEALPPSIGVPVVVEPGASVVPAMGKLVPASGVVESEGVDEEK